MHLATRFAELGRDVDLVTMSADTWEYTDELSDAVRVVDLNVPRLWTSLPAFRRYLRAERPDAVLSAMPLANGVAAWARVLPGWRPRVVLTEHNAISLAFGDLDVPRYRPLMWMIRWAYRFADEIVAVSGGVAERVLSVPGVRPERVHVIHNPCWTPGIAARAAEAADHPWLGEGGPPVILSAGRLEAQKDFGTLIRAFAALLQRREARLIILGEGSLRSALEAQARQLGIEDSISMPGFIPNPFSFMARASVFALTSRHEGFGNVLVEAMACGTPVVSTDCPSGPSEILEGGRLGPLVPVGDADALAAALEQQIDHPTAASSLQARAREFSTEIAADAYLALLGEGRFGQASSRACA
ncbi:MAG: glycosyltransferase [Parvibaculum sp.]|nr:glycosyltransferase [Parvibaculum sp.]